MLLPLVEFMEAGYIIFDITCFYFDLGDLLQDSPSFVIGLNAVIVAVTQNQPRVMTVRRFERAEADDALGSTLSDQAVSALPFGPFDPTRHRTLEMGLRSWVGEQTNLNLGYVEQLYTFGDRGRDPREQNGGPRVVSVGYLALVREVPPTGQADGMWRNWYRYFPWEDWRDGRPAILDDALLPSLHKWIDDAKTVGEKENRKSRVTMTFGTEQSLWDEEAVLERYELLYEAGLVAETIRDRTAGESVDQYSRPMAFDHRRILATAMGRMRGKLKYRPVVFELMPPTFTLLQLQKVVEALAGLQLHKQNFRRLVERNGLVEGTGKIESRTGGRPAETFRFCPEVIAQRAASGMRLPSIR